MGFVGGGCQVTGLRRGSAGAICHRQRTILCSGLLRPVLEKLVELRDLDNEDVSSAMREILDGEAQTEEVAAFLALLRAKKETTGEVAEIARAMRSRMVHVNPNGDVLEIVGTGGDGANTVNISTMSAVLASACGAKVAKHGNRSISSRSGSADVLEAVGVPLDLSPRGVEQCIDQAGIGFMFAPSHHPAMKRVQPVRRSLKIRTVFNMMGPLLNPAQARRGIIGVYTPSILELMASVLLELGCEHILVVHTQGIDELSTVGVTEAIEVRDNKMTRLSIDPLSFGLPRCDLAELKGGDAEYNAEVMRQLLRGESTQAISDVVALNAGAGLYVYGMADTIGEGVSLAQKTLQSGEAIEKLDEWVDVARKCERIPS